MVLRWGRRTSGSHGPRRDVPVEDVVTRGFAVAHVGVLAVVDEPRGVKSLQACGIHAVHEPTRRVPQSCRPRRVARVVQRLTVRHVSGAARGARATRCVGGLGLALALRQQR